MIKGISAVTLATHDMRRAVNFYLLVELPIVHGGEDAVVTSFRAGDNFLNLIVRPRAVSPVGRNVASASSTSRIATGMS